LNKGLGNPDPYYILPALAGITQWIQSRMMLTRSTDPQQQMMNTMMNFMPLMIVFFATRYASGLSLYWVTSTIIAILIQLRITGWGLLPILGNKTPVPAISPKKSGASGISSNGKGGSKNSPKQPKDGSNGQTGNGPTQQLEMTGTDGASEATNGGTAAPKPRKKANRARGGRGGGRRG
jgi:membrane protein insertase Oxa1/YidC/SpoIIIJ